MGAGGVEVEHEEWDGDEKNQHEGDGEQVKLPGYKKKEINIQIISMSGCSSIPLLPFFISPYFR